jgi:hypothetical protein
MENPIDAFNESFKKWADKLYAQGGLNIAIEKYSLMDDFLERYPKMARFCTMKRFKMTLVRYCDRNNYDLNPHREGFPDRRDKSNKKEYFLVAGKDFDARRISRIVLQKESK